MKVDHLVILEVFADGSFRGKLVDTKGAAPTAAWKNKVKVLKNNFGLDVEVMK